MVDGRSFTSNVSRLLKHTDKLALLRDSKPVSPVMIHLSLTNYCNLSCGYCCYANRASGLQLPLESAVSALAQFSGLGTRGLELTGGGEPTLYHHLDDVVSAGKEFGFDIGLITNGYATKRIVQIANRLEWARVSLHGLYQGERAVGNLERSVSGARDANPRIALSSVFICTDGWQGVLPTVDRFVTEHRLPTRVTPDLTMPAREIDAMMGDIGAIVDGHPYLFVSDFNVKTSREHDFCYMPFIKPFIFTDGNVYACPSLGLSPGNGTNISDRFKICSIEDITRTYNRPTEAYRFDCTFCKYAQGNELIHELRRKLPHENFA